MVKWNDNISKCKTSLELWITFDFLTIPLSYMFSISEVYLEHVENLQQIAGIYLSSLLHTIYRIYLNECFY